MLTIRFFVSTFLVVGMVLSADFVTGQNYPNKPVRILTGSPGGGNDAAARMIAAGISGPLGQPVIVENRGTSAISATTVASSPPDGYVLVLAGDLLWLGPLLRNSQYDPFRDFSPISMLASAPDILAVHPQLPVKSVKELIALAKARSGELNYSSGPAGGIDHLAGELFRSMTGVKIVWVPFKGGVPAIIGTANGEAQLTFASVGAITPFLKSGKLKPLAVTSAQPSALSAGLPTMAASGVPGFEIVSTDAIYAPAKTPAAIVNQLNQEIVRFVRTKDAQERYLALGAEVIASSPEEHVAKLKSRIATLGKVIKDAGIKVE